jgi:hypothetical protein
MGLCCVGTTGFIVSRKTFALPEVLILYPTTSNTHVPLFTIDIYLSVLSQNCEPSWLQHFVQESVVDSDFCRISTEDSR